METRITTPLRTGKLLVGCSMSVTTSSTNCPFDGSYDVTATRESGGCPDGLPAETWTFASGRAGDVSLTIPSRPAGARMENLKFDGTSCKATWTIVEPLDAACGSTAQTESYSAEFDSNGIHGSVSLASACLAEGRACDGTFSFSGSRN